MAATNGGTDSGTSGAVNVPNPPSIPNEATDAKKVEAPSGFVFTKAPDFAEPVRVLANRSSVRLFLPFVAGAKDYRAFILEDGVSTEISGELENVVGGTMTCAGLRQRNECDNAQAISEYGPGSFHVSACSEDRRSVHTPPTVLQHIEVNGLKKDTILAVEAIDSLCPFQGSIGNVHQDVEIFGADKKVQATYKGKLGEFPLSQLTFPIRTEAEMRKDYSGTLILNGHGHAPRDPDPMKGPFYNLAQPAPPVSPKVLNRVIISVKPTGTEKPPEGYKDTDIFEDFEDDTDQFTLVESRKDVEGTILPEGFGPIGSVKRYQNSKWNWYTFNGENNGDAAQVYIDKGELHMTMADIGQDVMGSNVIYPKRPVQLPKDDTTYLHITFEIPTDATQRRYWYFHMCGAAEVGKTYDGTALPNDAGIVATPFFMDPTTGSNISMAGWNCFQVVPRSGDFDVFPGGDVENEDLGPGARPETDIRMLVNRPTPAGMNPLDDDDSVILLDPAINDGISQAMGGSWIRTWDDNHKINGMMLDDSMFITQRTHLDFYINRTRVVMYANGAQKACDNIAAHKLTMAEAAVGIGQVFYHSSGERSELIEPQWIRTGQNYYLHNTPFTDIRNLDNVGIQEDVALPASFREARCFTTPAAK